MVSVSTLTAVCLTTAPGLYRRCFINVRAGLKTSSVRPHSLETQAAKKSHRHEGTLKAALGMSMGHSLGEQGGGLLLREGSREWTVCKRGDISGLL